MINEEEIKITKVDHGNDEIEERAETDEPSVAFLNDWFELTAVDRMSIEKQDRVRYIYESIKEIVGKADPMSIFQYLRDVSYKLGSPRLGVSKLQHIYQYIKLQNQRKVIDLKEEELRGLSERSQ